MRAAICCRVWATDFGPVDYGAKVLRCVSVGSEVRGTTSGPIDPRARGLRLGNGGLAHSAAAEGRIQGTSGSLAGILKGQSPLSRSGQSPERVWAEPSGSGRSPASPRRPAVFKSLPGNANQRPIASIPRAARSEFWNGKPRASHSKRANGRFALPRPNATPEPNLRHSPNHEAFLDT